MFECVQLAELINNSCDLRGGKHLKEGYKDENVGYQKLLWQHYLCVQSFIYLLLEEK